MLRHSTAKQRRGPLGATPGGGKPALTPETMEQVKQVGVPMSELASCPNGAQLLAVPTQGAQGVRFHAVCVGDETVTAPQRKGPNWGTTVLVAIAAVAAVALARQYY